MSDIHLLLLAALLTWFSLMLAAFFARAELDARGSGGRVFVLVYLAGIRYLRTLVFAVSVVGMGMAAFAAL